MDSLIGQQYQDNYTGEIVTVTAETLTTVTFDSGELTSREALNIHWTPAARPAMTPQRAARITHDARNAEHPHMSFAEQVDAGHPDPMPCGCWHAGRRDEIRGLRRDQVFHPCAFGDGWLSAYEEANDI